MWVNFYTLPVGILNWHNTFKNCSYLKQLHFYLNHLGKLAFSSVQSLSCVRLFVTPWIAVRQASLSITNSRSSLRLTSIKSMMPSSHLILCRPCLLLPPIPPSIRVFSSESTLRMRWPKYWSFSFSISPSKEIPGLISFRNFLSFFLGWFALSANLQAPNFFAGVHFWINVFIKLNVYSLSVTWYFRYFKFYSELIEVRHFALYM